MNDTICKECGLQVQWVKSGDVWQCLNTDDRSDHWDRCSQAKFARIKATGQYFETTLEAGYITPLKKSGVQMVRQTSGIKIGAKFVEPKCDCIPWIGCEICQP